MAKTVALIAIGGIHFIAFDPSEMETFEIDSDTLLEMVRKDHDTIEIKFIREKSDPRYQAFIDRKNKAMSTAKALVEWHNLIKDKPGPDQ